MRACTLPVVHKGCWGTESCQSHEAIINVMPYKINRNSYDLWCSITDANGNLLPMDIEQEIKLKIKRHPSVEGFNPVLDDVQQKKCPPIQKVVYQVTINDKGYSQGVVRILSRVKGVKIYPFVIMPIHNGTWGTKRVGIENITFFVDEEQTFEDAKKMLKQDSHIHFAGNGKSETVAESEITTFHPTLFNTFLSMNQSDQALLAKAMSEGILREKTLCDEENFFDLIRRGGPLLFKFVEIVSGVITMKELYDMITKLKFALQ
ncbi:MAG: hypothetical protein FWH37_08930 [Candidatus Bathyarchaeota archaeon]|nr:hypothetical protein [Candidatus Termiticorpusculum sp.]